MHIVVDAPFFVVNPVARCVLAASEASPQPDESPASDIHHHGPNDWQDVLG
jgi:hypothetical protein